MTMRDMSVFNILSWNVCGLKSKIKRVVFFRYLKSHCHPVILLKETHLIGSKLLALRKPWIQKAYHASYSTFARGVSTLISKSFLVWLSKYVIVVFTLWSQHYIIASVYIPPISLLLSLQGVLYTILERFTPYCPAKLLLMGDFNAILAPDLGRPQSSQAFFH